jgi:hypothetical protein
MNPHATPDHAANRAGIMERMPTGNWLVKSGHHYWFLPSQDAAHHFCEGYNARVEEEADDA